MFSQQELSEIKKLISTKNKIIITTHYNPDGDAVGSSLALKHYLKKLGVDSEVIVPNDFPKFLKWLPGANKIIIGEYKKRKALDLIEQAEIIFSLDYNTFKRTGILHEPLEKSKAIKILIDHHQEPDKFKFTYSATNIPATCQMVFNFIEAYNHVDLIDKETAQCLYSGIMTDTGGFRFRSTTSSTHQIIAKLIDKGANPEQISSNILDTNSVNRLHLLSLVLGRIEVVKNGEVAILWLKRSELTQNGFEKGDTDGFVNFGLSIAGVKISAFFVEDLYDDFIKISFRSKGDTDVNGFSRKHFNGGGHINAAGGRNHDTLEETINTFKSILEKEKI